MTAQRVIWTACPNGTAPNGNLRISVAIGPQLMPTGAGATLAGFPDWEDWPATQITWKAMIGTDVVDATVVSAAPSSPLYRALFLPTTPVAPYQYQSPTASALYTYPASTVRQFFAGLYTGLAKALPEGGGWHSWQEIVSDDSFGLLPLNGREMQDAIDQVLSAFPRGGGPIAPSAVTGPRAGVTQAYLFLQPRTEPPPYPTAAEAVPPAVPQFDFHQAFSLLQRHPALLRLFGFVVDLEVAAPTGLAATVPISVTPTWKPKLPNPVGITFIRSSTTNVTPVTMTTSATWLAEPRTTSPDIAQGLLRLSDPGAYQVIEVDLDGASVKALNFVQNVWNARFPMRSADTPSTYAVPSLRSAGLSLAKVGHAVLALPELAQQQRVRHRPQFHAAGVGHPVRRGHRPGLALRCLRRHPGQVVLPMCPDGGAQPTGDRRLRHRQPSNGGPGAQWGRRVDRAVPDPTGVEPVAQPADVRARNADALERLEPGGTPPRQAHRRCVRRQPPGRHRQPAPAG